MTREETLERQRNYYRKHRAKRLAHAKFKRDHPELGLKVKQQKQASAKRNIEKIKAYHRKWEAANRPRLNLKSKQFRWNLRVEAMNAYGGRCACCGEQDPHFLSIDHVHNDGASERRKHGYRCGDKFYAWLRRRGWPKGDYQVLCYNCNSAKAHYGVCPHQSAVRIAV